MFNYARTPHNLFNRGDMITASNTVPSLTASRLLSGLEKEARGGGDENSDM